MIKNIQLLHTEEIQKEWSVFSKITYQYELSDGATHINTRETYDRGNGATILLYNLKQKTVILTRQFRLPTYMNGNLNGMMIEACAGRLDIETPEEGIKRETEEETGYQVQHIEKICEAYMSPGSVTEILHFYLAEYTPSMQVGEGGGLDHEHEHIEVLELPFEDAISMIRNGEIRDAKTIILLQQLQISGKME